MAPSTRNHSRDQTATDEPGTIESCMTVVGDPEQSHKAQVEPFSTSQPASSSMLPPPTPTQDETPSTMVPDTKLPVDMGLPATPKSNMGPPVIPNSTLEPPTKPPRSGQMTASQQEAQAQPHKAAKPKKKPQPETDPKVPQKPSVDVPLRRRSSEHMQPESADESDSDASNSLGGPSDPMQSFDWADLQLHHNQKMTDLDNQEREALTEFHELSQFFGVWASASQSHEVGRSFKRMKTQFALVQHHEEELEQKRKHYVKAYAAFQSALALLSE